MIMIAGQSWQTLGLPTQYCTVYRVNNTLLYTVFVYPVQVSSRAHGLSPGGDSMRTETDADGLEFVFGHSQLEAGHSTGKSVEYLHTTNPSDSL